MSVNIKKVNRNLWEEKKKMSPSDARTPESLRRFLGFTRRHRFYLERPTDCASKEGLACGVIHSREGLQPSYMTNFSYTAYNEITL